MKIISHRGNLRGPRPELENRPSYIDSAYQLGFDIEVDLRFINGEFWLGHDEPQYKVDESWMDLRKDKIWFHCKDLESVLELKRRNKDYNYFCHSNDEFVLTSKGYVWVHNLKLNLTERCVIPLLGLDDINKFTKEIKGPVCTDYVYDLDKNGK